MGIESFLYMGHGIGETASLKKFGIELKGDSEEMIETTTLDDGSVYYPDTEETREEFKGVFNIPIFHHLVYDKADISDALSIGYEKSEKDKAVLTVFRKDKDNIFAINMFEEEEADRVYNLLTGGM